MPMPRWWAQVNKRVFNPLELERGRRAVLQHVGRVSGTAYRTPLQAEPIPGGYAIFVIYGPETDWLRNVLAAGGATLEVDGRDIPVTNPRVVPAAEVIPLIPTHSKPPPKVLRIELCLVLDAA